MLSLIEEIDTEAASLTSDVDIANKINYVINQVQYELSRVKKIPAYKEIEVTTNDILSFSDIDAEKEIYQLEIVKGIINEVKSSGTIVKCLEDGTSRD